MKKTILAVLLAMCALVVLCSACGGGSNTESVSVSEAFEISTPEPAEETPEPTEEPAEETAEPEETPEPEEEAEETPEAEQAQEQPAAESSQSTGGNSGGGNSGGQTTPAEPETTQEPERDKQSVAIDLIGSSVESLYSAIGSPNSSSYTESCLVLGGEDGFLYYDGFTVTTIRRADGSELVYDVY